MEGWSVIDGARARAIAGTAEFLHERIDRGHRHPNPGDATDRIEQPAAVARERFGMTPEELGSYVAFQRLPADEPLPDWWETFTGLLARVEAASVSPETDGGRPFESVFDPIVAYARERWWPESSLVAGRVSEDFEASLADQLVTLLGKLLQQAFLASIPESAERSPDATAAYSRYVRELTDGGLLELFERYPVAARLTAETVRRWGETVTEFIAHVETDHTALCDAFDEQFGRVTGVERLGDAHDGGRSVRGVTFASGDRLIYKPRSVSPEAALYEFSTWLADSFESVPRLAAPTVYDGGDHGWVAVIERHDFDSREPLTEYYERAGALVCILYVVAMTDCHAENVIAADSSPVIVDAETVLSRTAGRDRASGSLAETLRGELSADGVLGTAMLPVQTGGVDLSDAGLDDTAAGTNAQRVVWRHENTDAMCIEYRSAERADTANLPTLQGEQVPPDRFVQAVLCGFRHTYDAISESRETVKQRLDETFSDVPIRVVVSATHAYDAVVRTVTNPELLRDGAVHSGRIEAVLLAKLDDDDPFGSPSVVDAERDALLARDIPKFVTRTTSNGLWLNATQVDSFRFDRTPIDRASATIDAMSSSDRQFQSGLVEACLGTSPQPRGTHHTEGL